MNDLFKSILTLCIIFCISIPVVFSQTQSLKVISYNIKSIEPDFDISKHVEMILHEKPDVVAYQEVENRTSRMDERDLILEIASKTGMFTLFSPAYTKEKGVDFGQYGVAILSRFPISNSSFVKLPLLKEKGGSDERVGMIAKFITDKGVEITFINVHLDHKLPEEHKYEQLKPLLSEGINEKEPIILLGDFNAYPNGDFIKKIKEKFDKKCDNQPSFRGGVKIDYIFTYPKGKWSSNDSKVLDSYLMSDHYPITSILKYRK